MNIFVKAYVFTLGILSAFCTVIITLNWLLIWEDKRTTKALIKARKKQYDKEDMQYNKGMIPEIINGKYTGEMIEDI